VVIVVIRALSASLWTAVVVERAEAMAVPSNARTASSTMRRIVIPRILRSREM
jgi:hypothetical protein